MADQQTLQELFRLGDTSSRLRRLALSLEAISVQFGDGFKAADLNGLIDECTWMVECMTADEDQDVQGELAELQAALSEWSGGLEPMLYNAGERAIARERAGAWSDRLRWVSALLEATE